MTEPRHGRPMPCGSAPAVAAVRGAGSDTGGDCGPYRTSADADAAGKALAVWLYCVGGHSLAATDAAFRRRPAWRHA